MLLHHELAPHYGELRRIRTRKQLHASSLWRQIGREVETLLDAVERADAPSPRPLGRTFRAAAWNIQRGTHLDDLRAALTRDPELARADVLLLSEVDNGMGRSSNRNVARELAEATGMGYAFAVSYLALEDDFGENETNTPNTLALAASAILTRAPILRAVNADVPAVRDKFGSSEKRLGRKRAAIIEVATEAGPLVIAQAHLDSNADSRQRARQLDAILGDAERLGGKLLLGGDLNTNTYQYSSSLRLARDICHKLFVTGFDGTIASYLAPEKVYEIPVFDVLRAHDMVVDGFNQRGEGTIRYDFNEPYAVEKVRSAVGGVVTSWLKRKLRKWDGLVAAHLDWFAGKRVAARHAQIVRARGDGAERAPSDHDPIVVDVEI